LSIFDTPPKKQKKKREKRERKRGEGGWSVCKHDYSDPSAISGASMRFHSDRGRVIVIQESVPISLSRKLSRVQDIGNARFGEA